MSRRSSEGQADLVIDQLLAVNCSVAVHQGRGPWLIDQLHPDETPLLATAEMAQIEGKDLAKPRRVLPVKQSMNPVRLRSGA
jgi:hypothetical protein